MVVNTLMRRRILLRMRMTIMPTLMILVIIKYTLSVTLRHSPRAREAPGASTEDILNFNRGVHLI